MDSSKAISLLGDQVEAAGNGRLADFDGWRVRTGSVLRRAVGADHPLYAQFQDVRYSPGMFTSGTPDSYFADIRAKGVQKAVGILKAAILEIQEADAPLPAAAVGDGSRRSGVFLVHGHDARKDEVARAISQLTGWDPTILQEQANLGQTIIEKFIATAARHAFAVVVATADDEGRKAGTQALKPRARQNVVFEMGYFVAALGRSHVVVLHDSGVELPSDYDGVLFVSFDPAGAWKYRLGKEMRAVGLDSDINKLK